MNINYEAFEHYTGKHSYHVYAYVAGSSREEVIFNVLATNRDQAARRVEKAGHRVNSVNFTG